MKVINGDIVDHKKLGKQCIISGASAPVSLKETGRGFIVIKHRHKPKYKKIKPWQSPYGC